MNPIMGDGLYRIVCQKGGDSKKRGKPVALMHFIEEGGVSK
jgi:hypothetical protein